MNPTTIILILVVAGGAYLLFTVLFNKTDPSSEMTGRLNRYLEPQNMMTKAPDEDGEEEEDIRPLKERLRENFQVSIGSKMDKTSGASKMVDQLSKADLKLRPSEWMSIVLAVTIFLAIMAYLRFQSPLAIPIGGVIGFYGSRFYLKFKQKRRTKAFESQLGDVVLSLTNWLKAGHSFLSAVEQVGKNTPAPTGNELLRFAREIGLGVSIEDASQHLMDRNPSEDLELMMMAVQIQRQVGGNLTEILDKISDTIRARIKIKDDIKTLTSQARAQGWVVLGLPFALMGVLSLIAPAFFTPMFTTLLGNIMLGIAGFMMTMGYFIMRKMVKVKV